MYVFIFLLIQMSIEKIKNENILIKGTNSNWQILEIMFYNANNIIFHN